MKLLLPANADRDNRDWLNIDGERVQIVPSFMSAQYEKEHKDLTEAEIIWLVENRMQLLERLSRIRMASTII